MNARVDGDQALMVAARLADVDDLNRRARRLLKDEGYLGPDEIEFAGRRFAAGDEILALRNDYMVGVLNGTRGVIDHMDHHRRVLVVTAGQERLAVPFAYAEAGHLTHGYATTIHKAQGATVDRCLVLLDDTTSREHAYTAMSRGRQGNDLYLVAPDRRVEDRHAAEIEPDPLDELRAGVQRVTGKHLAVDQAETGTSIAALRAERDELRRAVGAGPPDRSWEHRELTEQRRREQNLLDGARWRLDTARNDLDRLGPIRRHTQRTRRHELEARIAGFDAEIGTREAKVAEIDGRLEALRPDVAERARWEHEHLSELTRLAAIDGAISVAERLHHEIARTLERAAERRLELEL